MEGSAVYTCPRLSAKKPKLLISYLQIIVTLRCYVCDPSLKKNFFLDPPVWVPVEGGSQSGYRIMKKRGWGWGGAKIETTPIMD